MQKSVNRGEMCAIEIDSALAIEVAQAPFQESTERTTEAPAVIADNVERKVVRESTGDYQPAVSCTPSSPPIFDHICHPISAHPDCSNEGTSTTSGGQLTFAQSNSLGQLVDNDQAIRTVTSEAHVSENEDFGSNVSQQVRAAGKEDDNFEADNLNVTACIGNDNSEKDSPVDAALVRHKPVREDERPRSAPVTESDIRTPQGVLSIFGDAQPGKQPIFESEGSLYHSGNSSAGNHAEPSRHTEDALITESQSSSQEVPEHLHGPSDDHDHDSQAEPTEGPSNGEGCSGATSAVVVGQPVAHSQDSIKSQPAVQSPQEGVNASRRQVRKRSAVRPYMDAPTDVAVSVGSSGFAIIPPLSQSTPALTDLHANRSDDATPSGTKRGKKRGRKSKQPKPSGDSDFANIEGSMHIRQGSINDCIVVSSNPDAGGIIPSPDIVGKRQRLAMEPAEMPNVKLTRGKRGRSKLVPESSESGVVSLRGK
ncbi:hypothetical protein V1525DRAFT_206470 [Lipomyces kononenkoae]|uniref:Uncharacterized protein n=1 Tax=Lipomyces kononenkoae TaxID=34357 RepID=A0ACC3TC62_LIPKO